MKSLTAARIRHDRAAEEKRLAYEDLIKQSLQAHREGESITRIAHISGISRMTLHKYVSAAISANLNDPEND